MKEPHLFYLVDGGTDGRLILKEFEFIRIRFVTSYVTGAPGLDDGAVDVAFSAPLIGQVLALCDAIFGVSIGGF